MAGSGSFTTVSLLPDGRHPGLMDLSADHKNLVIPCQESDNVCIFDVARQRVTASIQLRPGSTPWQAKVAPAGDRAYITNSEYLSSRDRSGPGYVSVIDLARHEYLRDIKVGSAPNGIAIAPDGRAAYIANLEDHSVSVIDLLLGEETARWPAGRRPFGVAVSPDGRFVAATNFEDASMSVWDGATRTAARTIQTGVRGLDQPNPEWGAGDTVGVIIGRNNTAYVTNWRSDSVIAVDLSSGRTLGSISPVERPFGLALSKDESVLYVASIVGLTVIRVSPTELTRLGGSETARQTYRLPSESKAVLWVTDAASHQVIGWIPEGATDPGGGTPEIVPLGPL